MKKRYKLSTGLSEIDERPEFDSDEKAWEYLRKIYKIPRYARLYREEIVENLPIVNRTQYVKKHNKKYTTQQIGKENTVTYWLPVLDGITSHSYRGVK